MDIIPRYGLKGSEEGVEQMLRSFQLLKDDADVQARTDLLGTEDWDGRGWEDAGFPLLVLTSCDLQDGAAKVSFMYSYWYVALALSKQVAGDAETNVGNPKSDDMTHDRSGECSCHQRLAGDRQGAIDRLALELALELQSFAKWLWVKNGYPFWIPGKWNQGLKPAQPLLFNFDPQPNRPGRAWLSQAQTRRSARAPSGTSPLRSPRRERDPNLP